MKRILVAGIGNIFLGDDGFGVAVARELTRVQLPPEVHVADFGIRSYDLAYALTDGYDAVILVDATAQGQPPGTVYVIQPDLAQVDEIGKATLDAHTMTPVSVLQIAGSLGRRPQHLYLVGCEPAQLFAEGGGVGLSEPVQAAIPNVVDRIRSLVENLLSLENKTNRGLAAV